MRGFDLNFDFDFDGGEGHAVADGSVVEIQVTSIAGTAIGTAVRRRRRRPIFFEVVHAEAPGSDARIDYIALSGEANGNAIAGSSSVVLKTEFSSGKATGQKVSLVSGKAFGDAVAKGSIVEISVSAVSDVVDFRADNDFLMKDSVVDPVTIDNDLLMAA